jgi:hypothetical protein
MHCLLLPNRRWRHDRPHDMTIILYSLTLCIMFGDFSCGSVQLLVPRCYCGYPLDCESKVMPPISIIPYWHEFAGNIVWGQYSDDNIVWVSSVFVYVWYVLNLTRYNQRRVSISVDVRHVPAQTTDHSVHIRSVALWYKRPNLPVCTHLDYLV